MKTFVFTAAIATFVVWFVTNINLVVLNHLWATVTNALN